MGYTTPFVMVKSRTGCVIWLDALPGTSPLTGGQQDHMERFWSHSIFKYLRVEPEDHYFLLTEPVRFPHDNTMIHFPTLTRT